MKKVITLLFLLIVIAGCSTEFEPEPLYTNECVDSAYIELFESFDLHNHYNEYKNNYHDITNRNFYAYMIEIDKFNVIREFQTEVKSKYPCLNIKDFKSLYFEYLKIKEKRN